MLGFRIKKRLENKIKETERNIYLFSKEKLKAPKNEHEFWDAEIGHQKHISRILKEIRYGEL